MCSEMTTLTRQWPSENIPVRFYGSSLDPTSCMTNLALKPSPIRFCLLVSHDFGTEVNPAQHTFFSFVRAIGLLLPAQPKSFRAENSWAVLWQGYRKKIFGRPPSSNEKRKSETKTHHEHHPASRRENLFLDNKNISQPHSQ